MKKGDVVVTDDGSFSRTIKDGKLIHGPGGDKYTGTENSDRKQYVIVETGCSFPGTGSSNSFNNTVIQAIESNKVVFIEERFLELVLPKHKVMIDLKSTRCTVSESGLVIEISDKLYQEIKRGSQS